MTEMFAIFVEPFQFSFMQNALLTALVVAVICALLSCYLVLKGWSLMGDAISHAVLPNIVVTTVYREIICFPKRIRFAQFCYFHYQNNQWKYLQVRT